MQQVNRLSQVAAELLQFYRSQTTSVVINGLIKEILYCLLADSWQLNYWMSQTMRPKLLFFFGEDAQHYCYCLAKKKAKKKEHYCY